ncbi:MAG: hypothetical protein PHP54_03620 [Clostridia bacterium]|nr:hypothetical protein [Clostridia bacterium]
MENNTMSVLDYFNKAIKMGEDSYALVIEKATDEEFKNLLQSQSKLYEEFLQDVNESYKTIDKKPEDTPLMQKVMGWTSIQMSTLADSSNSHISEMLIQGAIMGIIECSKLLNSYQDIDRDLYHKIEDFSKLQYKVIEELKPFLKK